jgi:hypothetical protein
LEVKESVTVEAYRSTYRSYGILAGQSESAMTKHSAHPPAVYSLVYKVDNADHTILNIVNSLQLNPIHQSHVPVYE